MGNYFTEIEKAKEQFDQGNYRLCSIQCGMIIESSLKALFKKCVDDKKLQIPLPYKNKPLDRLTFGELVTLCERSNILSIYENEHKLDRNEIQCILNRLIIRIRNGANHELKSEQEIEVKAGAHIIYGCLLLLQNAGFFHEPDRDPKRIIINNTLKPPPIKKPVSEKFISTKDRETPTVTPSIPQTQIPEEMITVYKNTSTGMYFIELSNNNEQMPILINPNTRIISLDIKHFETPEIKTIRELIRDNLITHDMLKSYNEHKRLYNDGKIIGRDNHRPYTQIFEYRIHGAKAEMCLIGGSYTVLKGSTAIREVKGSIPENAQRKRKDLIQSGILMINARGLLEFTKDVEFKSLSAASCVISGTSTDGWKCFKDSSGKTLKQHHGIKS